MEGTAGIQSTKAPPIPERIIWIKSVLEGAITGSVTKVVIPYIGWDAGGDSVIDVGAGTDIRTIGWDFSRAAAKVQMCFLGLHPCVRLMPSTYWSSIVRRRLR